jgi:hypothetical protein
MTFKWYADLPARWLRQLIGDLVVVAWLGFWAWLATQAHQQILRLAAPGNGLVSAGNGLRGTFSGAAHSVSNVPLIGHGLADALGTGTGVGNSLAAAGATEISAAHQLAFWVTLVMAVTALVPVLAVWLPLRLRYARNAGAVRRLARNEGTRELLALRALNNLPAHKLIALGPDAVTDWRKGRSGLTDQLVRAEWGGGGGGGGGGRPPPPRGPPPRPVSRATRPVEYRRCPDRWGRS